MALIECNECGGKVSDMADACPHCGGSRGDVAIGSPGASSRAKAGSATTTDKIICLLFPIAWPVVRFAGGRTGAGTYALAGIGVGFLLNVIGS